MQSTLPCACVLYAATAQAPLDRGPCGLPLIEPCGSVGAIADDRGHVSPEALGSPAGYVVPPGPRLLWPHPRLWLGPLTAVRPHLSPEELLRAAAPEGPQFTPPGCTAVPPPLPRWLRGLCLVVTSSTALAFART